MAKYLLLKSDAGFADRFQALFHAIEYCKIHNRILCVDWRDKIWKQDFEEVFDIIGINTISLKDFLKLNMNDVYPKGWTHQLDRCADGCFTHEPLYKLILEYDKSYNEMVIVYCGLSDRIFDANKCSYIRVKEPYRKYIINNIIKYKDYDNVLHLRRTDRKNETQEKLFKDYLLENFDNNTEFLIVSDNKEYCKEIIEYFPKSIVRTPYLDKFKDNDGGIHFQLPKNLSKKEFNLELLVDWFLLLYSKQIVTDKKKGSIFSNFADFLKQFTQHKNMLGFDKEVDIISDPLVSVIIPSYNRYRTLNRLISSIREQTYKNIEIIVVNDCSDDIRYIEEPINDVIIIHLEENSTKKFGYRCIGYVRNEGLKICKGDYICFIDDDDIFLQDKIKTQLEFMMNNDYFITFTESYMCHGNYKEDTDKKRYVQDEYIEYYKNILKFNKKFPNVLTYEDIKKHNFIIASSVMIKRDVINTIGYFTEDKKYMNMGDYNYWLRILEYYNNIYFIDKPLIVYDTSHGKLNN